MSLRVIEGDSIWSTMARGRGKWSVRRNEVDLKIIDGMSEECMNKGMLGIILCRVTKSDEMLIDKLEKWKKRATCKYRSGGLRRVMWRRHFDKEVCEMRGRHSIGHKVWKAKDNILSGMRNGL